MKWWFSLVLAGLACAPGWACTPLDALNYAGPDIAPLQQRLDAARAKLRAIDGLVSGAVSGNHTVQDREDSQTNYSLSLTVSRSREGRISAQQAIDDARAALIGARREGVRKALAAHAALWGAQAARRAAAEKLEAGTLKDAEWQRKVALGAAVAGVETESARLDVADAQLALEQAEWDLATAHRDAAHYALTGEAEGTVLRFALPDAPVESVISYRDLVWGVKFADAQLKTARRNARIGVRVKATYTTDWAQFEGGVASRGPSYDLTVAYPSSYDPAYVQTSKQWWSTVSFDIPLDPVVKAEERAARASLAIAQTRLVTEQYDLMLKIARAREAALNAERSLTLAQQRAALAERRRQLLAAQDAVGAVSTLAMLDGKTLVSDAEAGMANAWQGYITAVGTYLSLIDGEWTVAP